MFFSKYKSLCGLVVVAASITVTASAQATPISHNNVTLKGLSEHQRGEQTAATLAMTSIDDVKKHATENTFIKKDELTANSQSISDKIAAILNGKDESKDSEKNYNKILDYGSEAIMGNAIASPEQCVKYLLEVNPHPKISVSPEELVRYYYEEAGKEGIRPDAAFAQALKETGFFNYGGTVTPDQNNYCGLGTTSATVKGAYFDTARLGVRAHIQHLLAYTSVRPPREDVVDPRYSLVRAVYSTSTIDTWAGLNGRWAVPGNNYGQEILQILDNITRE